MFYTSAPMRCVVGIACLLLAGCAARVERVTMEPVVIRVGPEGATAESPDTDLDQALAFQEAGNCAAAIPRLKRFVEDYRESRRFDEAVYHLGLCHETEGDLRGARSYYRFVSLRRGDDLGLEAALRAAWILERLALYEDAAKEYLWLSRHEAVPEEIVAGARCRRVICLFRLGKTSKARKELPEAIRLYSAVDSPPPSIRTAAAEALFASAEEWARAHREIKLEYPQSRLERRVAEKLATLPIVREAYQSVVSIRDPEWAAAAVFRIGELYENLYDDLLSVRPPNDLNDSQRGLYEERLSERVRPLRQHAFDSYLQVVSLGERAGLANAWVEKSRQRVEVLEPLLKQSVIRTPEEESEKPPEDEPEPVPSDGAPADENP